MPVFDTDTKNRMKKKETPTLETNKKNPNNKDAHSETELLFWYPKHHES